MIGEIAYALAGTYSTDTAGFCAAIWYLNQEKGRHTLNALTGFVPGTCIGYLAEQASGFSGLMGLGGLVACSLNLLTEFPFKPSLSPAEQEEMYAKLRQKPPRSD